MHTLAAHLSIALARKLGTSPLNDQILILSLMYIAVVVINDDFRDAISFMIFLGISAIVLVINVVINGKKWLEKPE